MIDFLKQLKNLFAVIDRYFLAKIILFTMTFLIPLLIIFIFDANSFEFLWKGRAPYYLFLWLFFLEVIIGWKKLEVRTKFVWNKKALLTSIILILPTLYAIGLHFGLLSGIIELGKIVGVPIVNGDTWFLTHSWPFSFEYILFALLFLTITWLLFDSKGLKAFSVSSFFLGGVGIFYMIDTFYPDGTFMALQSLVPITTFGAAAILNLLGYTTEITAGINETLYLRVIQGTNSHSAYIAWSCAGSHSLFLYSFMIMLFLRGTSITRMRKIIYVTIGAAGTFLVNIFRIVTFYILGIQGGNSLANLFHEFYGEFFFIAWMFIYLTIIYLLETRLIKKNQDITNKPLD